VQFCFQNEPGSGYEFGDDGIVPNTPTLQVPQRSDGFAEVVWCVALKFSIVTCIMERPYRNRKVLEFKTKFPGLESSLKSPRSWKKLQKLYKMGILP